MNIDRIKNQVLDFIDQQFRYIKITGRLMFVIVILYFSGKIIPTDLLGVSPRDLKGLKNILWFSLIHKELKMMLVNLIGIFFLFNRYLVTEKHYKYIKLIFFQMTYGLAIWLFGGEGIHYGLRGIIYCLFSYMVFKGVFRKDRKEIISSIVVIITYQALLFDTLGSLPKYHWEQELIGFLTGVFLARVESKLIHY
jgi:hypothetical protein